MEEAARRSGDEEAARQASQLAGEVSISAGTVYLSLVIGLIAATALIVAGVGYLKMSKGAGYVMGHVYAILAIVNVIIGLAMLHSGFGFFTVIGLAYPVLTLILLNTTFKKCFA